MANCQSDISSRDFERPGNNSSRFQLSVNAKAPSTVIEFYNRSYTDPQRPDIHFFVFLSENLLVCEAGQNSTLNLKKNTKSKY